MKKAIVLNTQSGDWQGLYINGNLVEEGHTLGEGNSLMFMLKMSEVYKFKSHDVAIHEIVDADEEMLEDTGNFPKNIKDLGGSYGK